MACETRFLWHFFAASRLRLQPSGLPPACISTAIDGPGTHAPSPRPLSISMPVVVGLHGGALAHAIFLGPGQGLVEITPREHSCGHPSMFAHMRSESGRRTPESYVERARWRGEGPWTSRPSCASSGGSCKTYTLSTLCFRMASRAPGAMPVRLQKNSSVRDAYERTRLTLTPAARHASRRGR